MGKGVLLAVMLIAGASTARADILQGAFHVADDAKQDVYALAFGRELKYVASDRLSNGTLVVKLRASEDATGTEFEQGRLSYRPGEMGPIRTIALSGSNAKGYIVAITLARVDAVEVVPQSDFHRLAFRLKVAPPTPTAPGTMSIVTAPVGANVDPAAARAALEAGRDATQRGEYGAAEAAFTEASSSRDPEIRKPGLEWLGVAREYNGEKALAKAAWDQFLAEFPDAPEAARVRQRLLGLITRDLPGRTRLEPERNAADWRVFGDFDQFYRRYAVRLSGQSEVVGINAMFTDADVIGERTGEHYDFGFRFSGSNVYDMSNAQSDEHAYLVNSAYFEAKANDIDTRLRIGRQSLTSAGVLGHFDGAVLSYSPTKSSTISGVYGYALNSSYDAFSDQRPFYGLSGKISFFDGHVEFAPFIVQQDVDGMVDRRAIGLESRWFSERSTALALVDYDIFHDALNDVYVYGNFAVGDATHAWGSIDHRRSPYITTQNALIGMPFDDLSSLERQYTQSQIESFANDRTSIADFWTLGVDHDIGAHYQIGADVGYSKFSSTDASADVTAAPGMTDYAYGVHFRADDLFGSGGFFAAQLRFADGKDYNDTALYLSTRVAAFGDWFVYPRILMEYRQLASTATTPSSDETRIGPSLRIDYKWSKRATFEFESGYEWDFRSATGPNAFDSQGYFCRFGYRSVF